VGVHDFASRWHALDTQKLHPLDVTNDCDPHRPSGWT
jgi:hypothetical protein